MFRNKRTTSFSILILTVHRTCDDSLSIRRGQHASPNYLLAEQRTLVIFIGLGFLWLLRHRDVETPVLPESFEPNESCMFMMTHSFWRRRCSEGVYQRLTYSRSNQPECIKNNYPINVPVLAVYLACERSALMIQQLTISKDK